MLKVSNNLILILKPKPNLDISVEKINKKNIIVLFNYVQRFW